MKDHHLPHLHRNEIRVPALHASVAVLLVTLVLPLPGSQAADLASLRLDEAVTIALRDNAELNALRARADAMQERPMQADVLPNPMMTYGAMDAVSGGSWPDTGEKRLMVQQAFPGFGKRALRRGIALQEAAATQFEVAALARDLRMRVKETYFELRATRRVLAIAHDEQQLLRRLITIAETQYATGERPQVDVLKGQTELTLLKQKVLDLLAQESTLQARLNALLNRPAESMLGETITAPDLTAGDALAARLAQAATNRPEVLAAEAQVSRSRLEQALMAKEGSPDYRIGVEYRDFADSADMVMLTVSVDLPLWRSKVDAGVREAARMRRAGEAALEAARRQATLDAQEAAFRLLTDRRSLELYTAELIPQAETRLAASEAAYRTGKTDFLDLLESERFLLNARTMAAQTEGTAAMQAARLERALGSPPLPDGGAVTGGPQP